MPFKFRTFDRTIKAGLGLLVVVAVTIALFDWNWFRHPLERYLIDRSHREIRIGDLHVEVGLSLEPTVRVRDVYIENAPWADKRPFLTAREVSFTFSLRSVWQRRPVISHLVLIDADLDMERQADGLRNWRLRNPEDRGPGKVRVQSLEPHGAKIRFVRRDVGLDMTASSKPSALGAEELKPDTAHPTRIDFKGEFGGAAFTGAVVTSEVLTFLDTGRSFPMRGHASAAKSRFEVDGTIADMFEPSAIDADVRLAGPSLANLKSFFRGSMPASKPYDFAAHLTQTQEATIFAKLRGKIGDSDLAGEISIDRGKERLTVRADLRSESADVADLRSLFGARPVVTVVKKVAQQAAATDEADDDENDAAPDEPKAAPLRHLFSAREFDATKLNKLDAHATLAFKKLKAAEFPALESLHAAADLKDGVLSLKPVDVGLAGGHVTGQLRLDGRQRASASHASIELKDVRLEQLLAAFSNGANARKGAGALQGYLDLKGEGDSIAKLAASASGPVHVEMTGGAISNLLDAEIALNAGKALKALIKGDRAIGVNSATVAFDFDKGIGKSKAIVLDTDQTQTQGTGTINLRDETLDLLLTPHPKKTALLALNSSIRVHGSIRKPKISLAEKAKPGSQKAESAVEDMKEQDVQPARDNKEHASDLHDTPVAQPTGRK
jgi:uncharacterized protein involved in outer membrane biogenesis